MHTYPARCPHAFTLGAGMLAGALLSLTLAGCGKEPIRYHPRVPKDEGPVFAPAHTVPNPHQPIRLEWTVPAGWTDKGASGMRAGSFAVEGTNGQTADISVIPLSSWAGRELENLNRWRAQVGLQPIPAEELAANTGVAEIAGQQGEFYEMAGTPVEEDARKRILAAVLPLPGGVWTFKMFGDDALVLREKPAFEAFLKSVKLPDSPGTTRPRPTEPEQRSPPAASRPAWTVPTAWKEQSPGALQLARFLAGEPDAGQAEITVTVLPGDGGGVLANVNRWRQQIGLAAVDPDGLAKLASTLDLGHASAMLVDMIEAKSKTRVTAAILPREGQTWFYKLSGDEAEVGRQKEAFVRFIRSAQ